MKAASAGKVRDKFRDASKKTNDLLKAIDELTQTERHFYYGSSDELHANRRRKRDRESIGLNKILGELLLFSNTLSNCLSKFENVSMQGTTPNYAEHSLVMGIDRTLESEFGSPLPLTRGGGLDELNRALILLFLEGFSSEEIAEVVGISASNVSTRINRLKIKLQSEFNVQKEGKPA